MDWQTLVIEPASARRRRDMLPWIGLLAQAVTVLLLLAACGGGPYLARYADADVLYTTPAEVARLCRLAPVPAPAVIQGCYVPALRLAIVAHGDAGAVAHELRHAREGAFHP